MEIVNVVAALPRHVTKRYSIRQLDFIKGIVVHHTAGSCACATEQAELRAVEDIARYHVNSKGWPGIGYHYVIAPDGTIYKTNNLTTLCYHAVGFNKATIGICLMGNFDQVDPTGMQLTSLRALVAEIRGALIQPLYVKGHRETSPTRCPGDRLFVRLKELSASPSPP